MTPALRESAPESDMSCLEIRVDAAVCRAAGECVFRAPESFAIGDEGKARWIESSHESVERILAAARSCPNFAISVRMDGRELT